MNMQFPEATRLISARSELQTIEYWPNRVSITGWSSASGLAVDRFSKKINMELKLNSLGSKMRLIRRAAISATALWMCATGSALAIPSDGLIGVNPGFPQIDATGTSGQGASYDAFTRILTITATPNLYFPDANTLKFIANGMLTLTAMLDLSGNISGGSLIVNGTVPPLNSPLLLGDVTNVGIEDSNIGDGTTDRGDFVIAPTGGSIFAGPDWPAGADIWATVTFEGSSYAGSFDSDWSSNRAKLILGASDVVKLAEPASLQLLFFGLIGALIIARRRPI